MTTKASVHGPGRCRQLLGELFPYFDDELTPARCAALERHLDACRGCGALAENIRRAIALCRLEGKRRLPPKVRASAKRRVAALLADLDRSASSARSPAPKARKTASVRRTRTS